MNRPEEAEKVAKLVQDERVLNGKWKSPYDIGDWQLPESLPWQYQPALKFAEMVLSPFHDWKFEAFQIEVEETEGIQIDLTMKYYGKAPLKTPLLKDPSLNLRQVVVPLFRKHIEEAEEGKDILKIEFPGIFALKPEGEPPTGFNHNLIPAYDRMLITPFWFYEDEGGKEKKTGTDPYRLILAVRGASIAYIKRSLLLEGAAPSDIHSIVFESPQLIHERMTNDKPVTRSRF